MMTETCESMVTDMIRYFEGFHSRAYLCPANILTIGFGRTGSVRINDVTDLETETKWLERFISQIRINLASDIQLSTCKEAAIVDFIYNLGFRSWLNSTLRKVIIEDPDDFSAINHQLNRWVYAGGVRLRGLERRRNAESLCYQGTSLYQQHQELNHATLS
jgi:lysozyme